jgi:hypothetical protein
MIWLAFVPFDALVLLTEDVSSVLGLAAWAFIWSICLLGWHIASVLRSRRTNSQSSNQTQAVPKTGPWRSGPAAAHRLEI